MNENMDNPTINSIYITVAIVHYLYSYPRTLDSNTIYFYVNDTSVLTSLTKYSFFLTHDS